MASIKKILIVRFSSIGDIVLTTPVIRNLKRHFPDASIHYLTKPQYAGILESNPYLDEIHVLDNDWGRMAAGLKNEKFDVLIDLHNNLRTRLLKWNLRLPSHTFSKINLQKWLMVNLKINRLPERHIVDRYMDTVLPLGVTNDGEGLDYYIPIHDHLNMGDFIPAGAPYNVYAIGGQHGTKKYPVKHIRELAEMHSGYLVLLGGAEDRDAGEHISSGMDHVIDLCGKINISQSASVVYQSQKVITHDTGMMHIAAAFKKPVISLWGNTIPEFGMTPYMAGRGSEIIEVKGLPCRPCSKIGFEKCPKGHFNCMNGIPPERIMDAVIKD